MEKSKCDLMPVYAATLLSLAFLTSCGSGLNSGSSKIIFSPKITSVSPTSSVGVGGGLLSLDGSFSPSGNLVKVGTETCVVQSETHLRITCTLPTNPDGAAVVSQQKITVTSDSQSTVDDVNLTYFGDIGLWLDANDASTFTLATNSVTEWSDKSGHARNASGGVSPTRTSYSASGKYFVSFDGASQWLNLPTATWSDLTTNLESTTIIAVVNPRSLGTAQAYTYRNDGIVGDSGGYFGLFVSELGVTPGIDGTVTRSAPFLSAPLNQSSLYITTLDSSVLNLSGPDLTLNSTSPGAIKAGGATSTLRLGRCYNTYASYFDGDIGEILIFNRKLTNPESAVVAASLKSSWGL